MSTLRQLEVDAALGTWDPRLTAGIGMEPAAASKSQVLFYLSESASDLSGRTPQKDPSLKAVCFYSASLLSHYSQCRMKMDRRAAKFLKFQLRFGCSPSRSCRLTRQKIIFYFFSPSKYKI